MKINNWFEVLGVVVMGIIMGAFFAYALLGGLG